MTLSCPFFLTVKNMPLGTRADSPGALLRHPSFPRLWGVWLMANVCMWMSDVAAVWPMTSLTDSKLMVAMIQTCTTLPVFLLALPGGAIADIVDRRSGFLAAQCWTALAAAIVFNGMAVNASLVLVLLLAGVIIAWLGGAWVFALTATGIAPCVLLGRRYRI